MKSILFVAILTLTLVACGKGTNPMDTIDGTPGKGEPVISLPVTAFFISTITPFQATNTVTNGPVTYVSGLRFSGAAKTGAFSPAAGLVTEVKKEIGNATTGNNTNYAIFNNTYSVRISIDSKYDVRVRLLDSVTITTGDYITLGQQIGLANGNTLNIVQIDVVVEGREVCPYSFLDAAGKLAVSAKMGAGQAPCAL